MKKRILSLLLAVVMLFGVLPVSAFAAEDTRIEITTVVARSDMETPVLGGQVKNVSFSVSGDNGVRFGDDEIVGWYTMNGEEVVKYEAATFTPGVYVYLATLYLDGEAGKDYVLSESLAVIVDGNTWVCDALQVEEDASAVLVAYGFVVLDEIKTLNILNLVVPKAGQKVEKYYDEIERPISSDGYTRCMESHFTTATDLEEVSLVTAQKITGTFQAGETYYLLLEFRSSTTFAENCVVTTNVGTVVATRNWGEGDFYVLVAMTVPVAKNDGWVEKDGKKQYYINDRPLTNEWEEIDGKWYIFDADGYMITDKWMKDSKGWVKLGADGAMLTNKWTTDSKGWCYVGADGYAVTNTWKKDSKGWIYLDANGSMTKSEWVLDGGKWYYLDANGYMISNMWMKTSKGLVYFEASGAMAADKWVKDSGGHWIYVGADGRVTTNCWKKDSKGWIYLGANGSMTKSKWVLDGGKWYYLDANGYMVTNKWQKDSKGWVKLGTDGAMLTNKWTTDSKGWCYVGADGYAVTNCWKKDSHGWIYLDANGSMTKSKWVEDGGKWYYCDASGYMVADTSLKIGDKTYKFNASGVCTNP